MKILKVIHGYPPYYSAGSEVYSQMLAQTLADKHEVQVFARYENDFETDFHYKTELDYLDSRILLHLINIPLAKYRYQYINQPVNKKFIQILQDFQPDIIHFGHLNHLSLSLPEIASNFKIPTIYTLHDFWLMCARGRFIQRNSKDLFKLCNGQDDIKCAKQCYSGYFSGDDRVANTDLAYWQKWIKNRMHHARSIIHHIDHFIAPSRFLMNKFIQEFDLPQDKLSYLDYGFDLSRLVGRVQRQQGDNSFVFGYIGTHTPEKGVDLLLQAFANITTNARLKIWGKARPETSALYTICQQLPEQVRSKIDWMNDYQNEQIVQDVFNHVDCIVVPSIWGENSPLVIHEAQQVKVPVITADYGGMAEYVHHNVNGLLFEHRNFNSLAKKMQLISSDQTLYNKLSTTGYLYSGNGNIINIDQHVLDIEKLYHSALSKHRSKVPYKSGPWRITFDTNPDYCNYACVMCECFSPYSKTQEKRVQEKRKPKMMPFATIRQIIQEAVGTPLREIIPSTMGEPLMYKHFDDIINLCHEFGLKLNLTTNGSFVIKGAQKWAELLVPVLSDIKISWNGATKHTHEKIMIGAKWEGMLNNLKIFLAVRDQYYIEHNKACSVTLQLTFLEDNLLELYDLVKMAIELGVNRVKGHHLWAHFDEIQHLSMRRNQGAITRWNEQVERIFKLRDQYLLPNGKKIKLENFTILNNDAVEDIAPGGVCPFLGQEAWVDPDGKFSPCCAPDEQRKTLGDFGNVSDQSLNDIWQSEQYQNLRKNYLNYDICKKCNMKKSLVS